MPATCYLLNQCNVKTAKSPNVIHCQYSTKNNIVSLFLQAASAETAESKGSPGFFSQVLSELAAPLYEDDEQDFLSEDSDSENPSTEDESGNEEVEDALHQSNKGEGRVYNLRIESSSLSLPV